MRFFDLLIHYWHFNRTAIIIALALIVFEITTYRHAPVKKYLLFFTGVVFLLVVSVSPLAYLANGYLFSAHMIAHIVLLLVVPPLLLTGTNAEILEKLHGTRFRKTGEVLFSAPVAWLIGMGAMYFWHIPVVFNAMLKNPAIHVLHMISLLVMGIIFIWPVYSPIPWKRITPLQSALYLFIACTGCTVLGIFITFSPSGLYMPYLTGHNMPVRELIQSGWGITPSVDQQAGGLIMWVPACIIYLTNIMLILAGYYNQPYYESD